MSTLIYYSSYPEYYHSKKQPPSKANEAVQRLWNSDYCDNKRQTNKTNTPNS